MFREGANPMEFSNIMLEEASEFSNMKYCIMEVRRYKELHIKRMFLDTKTWKEMFTKRKDELYGECMVVLNH